MAYIDQTVIEEIKLRNDIEQVISGYVGLKRAGSNMQGLCPFHSEKSPSFTVFTKDQNFYCFGCGAGGDVITFIRRAENLDYPSAVEFLAKRAGITIERGQSEKNDAYRRERTLKMNTEAAHFYHEALFSPSGKPGLDYLMRRGLTTAQIKHFGLGFAPDSFSALTPILRAKGFTDDEMSSAFLCGISRKNGSAYDYFRNRVIFPIISTSGDVIAFGGRVMDDSQPKYLNSSDTPAFKKSRNLFALNFARAVCSEQMILCEGYMDVIALHGAGFTNAVATLGTAITSEQARIMKRYTKKVIICYDADAAGQNASYKAFRLLGEAGLDCSLLKVENAKDPDEYIKKFGADAFTGLMGRSRSEFDFKLDNIIAGNDINTTDGKIKALEQTVEMISYFPGDARREIYIRRVAELLAISPELIKRDVDKSIKKKSGQIKHEEFKKILTETEGFADRVNPDLARNPRAARAEEAMLAILLLHPEYMEELKKKDRLPEPDEFFTEFGRKVYKAMLSLCGAEGGFREEMLGETLTVDELGRLAKIKRDRADISNNTIELFYECLETLRSATGKDKMDISDIIKSKRQSMKDRKNN